MDSEESTKLSHDWLVNTVQEKYRQKQLGKSISVTTESMGLKGDNFTSDIERVKMIFSDQTGTKERTVLLVAKINKTVELSGHDRHHIWDNRVEVEVYENVLRLMEELMTEYNDKRGTMWPKMYGHIPYSVLLLEDLGQFYKMVPRTIWLDDEHSILGLRSLARYHAMSKILIQRRLLQENYRNIFIIGIENSFHDKLFTGAAHLLLRAMSENMGSWKSVELREFLFKRLKLLTPTIYEKRIELYSNFDERFAVLNHGDFKSSNLMFRTMEYTGRPTGLKFVDFQIPHINSFAWDVTYFIATSVDPSMRHARRDELLKAYQQSLADNLKFFNYEGYVPTIDDVRQETDRLALAEFTTMLAVTPILISRLPDAAILEKIVTHPPEEAINMKIYGSGQFIDGVFGDFERAIALNVI